MATRNNASNINNVNKVYGPIAASAKPKPKPVPSPTAVSQLDAYLRTANPETGRIDVVRKGTYKGKSYDVNPSTGKITLNVKDTKDLIAGNKRDKKSKQDITKIPGFKFGRGTE